MQDAHEPLSWLTLERYALGELSAEERRDVEARLAESEQDRACLAEILSDKSELPPLPSVSSLDSARKKRNARWLGVSATLCAAAAVLLVLLRPSGELRDEHVKGREVALRLVSDRQGPEPTQFSAGERFKVEVTCPPSLSGSLRLLVLQGAELFEPLPRDASFRCGNLVPWPGAFALDGSEPAEVCIYWGTREKPDRAELARAASCRQLSSP
jgi:hypothetical protein